MKSALIASIILILLVTVVFLYGIIAPEQISLQQEISVEAPEAAVYNLLTSFADYQSWSPAVEVVHFSDKEKIRRVRYLIDGHKMALSESCMSFPDAHAIQFVQMDSLPAATLDKINQHILLKTLPDGSTTVRWSLEYTQRSLMGRILDRWFVQPKMRRFLTARMQGLKSYLER